ncbi:MAG: hypothetical protein AAF649_06520 [Verrucomicrobiota bacterium]
MKQAIALLLSGLLVCSVIGASQQSSHVWVQVAKASHTCTDGKCCSQKKGSEPERQTKCPCGPCDIAIPPATVPLSLPEATRFLGKPCLPSEDLLALSILFSSLNWSPPVPPPQH